MKNQTTKTNLLKEARTRSLYQPSRIFYILIKGEDAAITANENILNSLTSDNFTVYAKMKNGDLIL